MDHRPNLTSGEQRWARRGRIRRGACPGPDRTCRRCRFAATSATALRTAARLDRLPCRRASRLRIFGRDSTSAFFGTPVTFSTNPSGVIGGLEAGYDYQFSPNWLVGAELELSWTTASGNFNFITTTPAGAIASGIFNSNHHWYDTFTGRVGYVISDWVLYAKGGAAWINADYNLAVNGPSAAARSTTPAWICFRLGRRMDVRAGLVDQARI